METLLLAADENAKQVPNMELAQRLYKYDYFLKVDVTKLAKLKAEILTDITTDAMLPLYKNLCAKYNWELNEDLVKEFESKLEADIKKIDEKMVDALENAGDAEVVELHFEKAKKYSSVGDWDQAIAGFDEVLSGKKKVTSNKKIDSMCEKARIYLFNMDLKKSGVTIEETKKLNEMGGDWDRRNRLKIYEALYLISSREVKKAAPLLLECIETFTCVELCSYSSFILYTVLCNIISLPRTDLYKKVIKNPQVIAMIGDIPHLKLLLHSIYDCNYDVFLQQVLNIQSTLAEDRYFGSLVPFIVREYTLLAYTQYLEPYKSVLLNTMAAAFGMSTNMLDAEISKFISSGKISAKIDKVEGIIQNSLKYDKRNIQYAEVIQSGDVVLNQIQKLARALEM